jgi:hypothetical protein
MANTQLLVAGGANPLTSALAATTMGRFPTHEAQTMNHRRQSSNAGLWILAAIFLIGGIACLAIWLATRVEKATEDSLTDAKESECKLKIKTAETAVMGYYYKHQKFPDNLDILTQRIDGSTAYLRPDDIVDPWGRPLRYEPKRLSSTGSPRISSPGAPTRNRPISNWNQ